MSSSDSVWDAALLEGKVAFLSGGGSGIGFGISAEFMRHGCACVIASRNMKKLNDAAAQLRMLSSVSGRGSCLALRMDVRSETDVRQAVAKAIETLGRIDILVNCAAGNFLSPARKLSANAFNTVLQIDTVGTFVLSREVYTQWMRDNGGGSIINITATLHMNGEYLQVHPAAAKAAIEGMSKTLANEWGGKSVRVNNIAPGPIADTEGFRRLGGFLPAEMIQSMRTGIPLKRFGSVADIANAAMFLSSHASSYVTGTTLIVDGGAWMMGSGVVARMMPGSVMSKL